MPTSGSVVEATIVPTVVLPPAVPFTSQTTAVSVVVVEFCRLTVAVNSDSVPICTLAEVGEIAIEDIFPVLDPPQANNPNIDRNRSQNKTNGGNRMPHQSPPARITAYISTHPRIFSVIALGLSP